MNLVLSLFPGIGLLDTAFEQEGFTVVRGPDLIWGGDVRSFNAPPGVFCGVIGGPPCQSHSTAGTIIGTQAIDLIPEFLRIADQAKPNWIAMENVQSASNPLIPAIWNKVILRDYDCGGLTSRKRAFWTYPFSVEQPSKREGKPELSVMATTWKRGSSSSQYCKDKGFLPGDLPLERYAELQGYDISGLSSAGFSRRTIIHLLGNGVPVKMGRWVARQARAYQDYLDNG